MAQSVVGWHAEHVNFVRLLDLLDTEVAAFQKGEHPNYQVMGDIVFYMRSFGDRFHHPREDVAFTRLVARDPAMDLVINRLLQEHRVIAIAGDALSDLLREVAEDIVISRADLEAAAATYLVYYRHHIATEERDVLPRAAKLLTPEDWAAVVAAVPVGPDPLFGDNPALRFRDLRRQVAIEAKASRHD